MERYRTIVADPPWHYDGTTGVNRGRNAGGRKPLLPYRTMTVEQITALPVRSLAETNAHLLLWTTNRYVLAAYRVAEAWGFRPSTLLAWCKPPVGIGPGGVFAMTTEYVLYARRGMPEHLSRQASTWWQWPRAEHSTKPDAFLDLVEATFPGPYVELFARRARFGWAYWGDESLGTAEMEATA